MTLTAPRRAMSPPAASLASEGTLRLVELGWILRVRHPRVREQAGVVGLVRKAELAPALERVDHGPTLVHHSGTVAVG